MFYKYLSLLAPGLSNEGSPWEQYGGDQRSRVQSWIPKGGDKILEGSEFTAVCYMPKDTKNSRKSEYAEECYFQRNDYLRPEL